MELWIPKKICKNKVLDNENYESCFVYIHTETYKNIVKKYKESLDD